MTAILGRRAGLTVVLAGVALVAAGCIDFIGTKEIEGDPPPDAEFVVEITCVHDTDGELFTEELVFTEDGQTESTGGLPLPPGNTTCTIVETEDAGATSVEYQCGAVTITPASLDEPNGGPEGLGGGPGASVAARGVSATTAECFEFDDRLEVEIFMASMEVVIPPEDEFPGFDDVTGDSEIEVEFTVINTFEEPPPTTTAPTTTTAPAPAPAADAAAPSVVTFTG